MITWFEMRSERDVRPLAKCEERKRIYKVGGALKSCARCRSGDVFRSYAVAWTGWEHICFTCGARDKATGFESKGVERRSKRPFKEAGCGVPSDLNPTRAKRVSRVAAVLAELEAM